MDFDTRRVLRDQVRDAVDPVIVRAGFELVAVEFAGDQGRSVLRLFIDRPGGISIADCASVSRLASPAIDVLDPVTQAYNLEVSSPGMERPLQRPEDFERFKGYRVKVRTRPGSSRRRYTGVLCDLEDQSLILEVDGTRHSLPMDDVDRVRLQLDPEEYSRLGQLNAPAEGETP